MLQSLAASWMLIIHCSVGSIVVWLWVCVGAVLLPVVAGVQFLVRDGVEGGHAGATVCISSLFVVSLFVWRRRQLRFRAKIELRQSSIEDFEKPSMHEAIAWQADNQWRKYGSQRYPLWTTTEREFGQLGIGMGLYFQSLLYFAKVSALSTILGAGACAVMEFGYETCLFLSPEADIYA